MEYSAAGLALTQQFEGCSLTAYQDQVGVWTIGYGHTGGVTPGKTCTQDQATAFLTADVQGAVDCVNSNVTATLTQGQFDALVDFVFNLGAGAFMGSTLLAQLNLGNYSAASQEFPKWDHAGGKVVTGLWRRRMAEQAMFNEVSSGS
jgi:lysozyme